MVKRFIAACSGLAASWLIAACSVLTACPLLAACSLLADAAYADVTLAPKDGAFTVQVPGSAVSTHEVTLNPKHHPITTYHFHIEDAGVTYNISYADGVGEVPYDVYRDIAPVCEQMTDPIPVSAGKVPGIFFTGTLGPDYWYNYHVYKKGDRLFYIFIFAPKVEDFGRAQLKIKTLNDSFKITSRLAAPDATEFESFGVRPLAHRAS